MQLLNVRRQLFIVLLFIMQLDLDVIRMQCHNVVSNKMLQYSTCTNTTLPVLVNVLLREET